MTLFRNLGAALQIFEGLADRGFEVLRKHQTRLRPLLIWGSLCLFCVGVGVSIWARPDLLTAPDLIPTAALVVAAMPLGLYLSVLDFQAMGRLSGVRVPTGAALEVVIASRAANTLPVPGSILVRIAALKAHGVTFKRSGGLSVLLTFIWGGGGFLFSGACLMLGGHALIGGGFLLVSAALLAGCFMFGMRGALSPRGLLHAAGLRFLLVALEAGILFLALQALRIDVGYGQAGVLAVSSFLAIVVPAGLGVKETIIALLSPIAGIAPTEGFLAAAFMRIIGLGVLALVTAGWALAARGR